jgi:CTP:molybdopterin cytidylyltransferase MocA
MSGATALPVGSGLGGVVLAAGESLRMGGRPKALLERDGVPLVRRTVEALLAAGVREIVTVLGYRADDVAPALAGLPVHLRIHAGWAAGQVSSLRAGLAALPAGLEAVVVALADQPLLEARDVVALIDAFAGRGAAAAVVPWVRGERGNPVVFEATVRDEVLAGDGGSGVRQWLDAHPGRVARFATDNVHYREDVDAPEDIERIGRQHGCALCWPAALAGQATAAGASVTQGVTHHRG